MGVFYDDAEVVRADKVTRPPRSTAKTRGWSRPTWRSTFRTLKVKGELAIILIVATKAESSSIFYASIPDNADPQLVSDACSAMADLRVEA